MQHSATAPRRIALQHSLQCTRCSHKLRRHDSLPLFSRPQSKYCVISYRKVGFTFISCILAIKKRVRHIAMHFQHTFGDRCLPLPLLRELLTTKHCSLMTLTYTIPIYFWLMILCVHKGCKFILSSSIDLCIVTLVDWTSATFST